MLFGDADIEGARGKDLRQLVDAGAVRHGGGNPDDPVVEPRFLDERFSENARIARRIRLRLRLRAGDDVELVDAVILVGCGLGRRSEEHTSELQSLMRISYAVFCLKKKIHMY